MKIPYSIRVLKDKLHKENEELKYWHFRLNHRDPLIQKQAAKNYSSCQNRIEDLQIALSVLQS